MADAHYAKCQSWYSLQVSSRSFVHTHLITASHRLDDRQTNLIQYFDLFRCIAAGIHAACIKHNNFRLASGITSCYAFLLVAQIIIVVFMNKSFVCVAFNRSQKRSAHRTKEPMTVMGSVLNFLLTAGYLFRSIS